MNEEKLRQQNIELKRKVKRGVIFIIITILVALYDRFVPW
ncbi:hypothetical protein CLV25_10980 [Acetobacteroides hydrogenigenes]|uniref:Uncharacterized protein n=1 Tax=Acetobacteroides hydrogenigenes TaxID=979970 RepID=A0A4R2EDR1_9BACT|nr:hypothetical protein CLV25_10980 [Acetobacteroides hydrogenigenes]